MDSETLQALFDGIEALDSNGQRTTLEQVVQSLTTADEGIWEEIFEHLLSNETIVYDHLHSLLKPLVDATIKALTEHTDAVRSCAAYLWLELCKVEGDQDTHPYIPMVVPVLVPVLYQTLQRVDENETDYEGSWAYSIGQCLCEIAKLSDLNLMNYFNAMPSTPGQHCARMIAAGCMCYVPDANKDLCMALLTEAMTACMHPGSSSLLQIVSAQTLCQIIENMHGFIEVSVYGQVLPPVIEKLRSVVRSTYDVTFGIQLLSVLSTVAKSCEADVRVEGSLMQQLAPVAMQVLYDLLTQTKFFSDDWSAAILSTMRANIISVPESKSGSMFGPVCQMIMGLCERVLFPNNAWYSVVQACRCLSACFEREPELAEPCFPANLIIQIFQHSDYSYVARKEALLLLGNVVALLENKADGFSRAILTDLLAHVFADRKLVRFAADCVGDVARSCSAHIIEPIVMNDTLPVLLKIVNDNSQTLKNRQAAIEAIGDLSMCLGKSIVPALSEILAAFKVFEDVQPSEVDEPHEEDEIDEEELDEEPKDDDTIVNECRYSLLQSYSGLLQGLVNDNLQDLFLPATAQLVSYCQNAFHASNRDASVLRCLMGTLGDLSSALGERIKDQLRSDFVTELVAACGQLKNDDGSPDKRAVKMASWAQMYL